MIKLKINIKAVLTILLLISSFFTSLFLYYNGKIYPNVYIADINFGGLTIEEAKSNYNKKFVIPENIAVKINTSKESLQYNIAPKSIDAKTETDRDIEKAYSFGRSGKYSNDIKNLAKLLFRKTNYETNISINEQELDDQISVITGAVSIDPILPYIKLQNKLPVIIDGKNGESFDANILKLQVINSLKSKNSYQIIMSTNIIDTNLTPTEKESFLARANILNNKSLMFTYEYNNFVFDKDKLLKLISPKYNYYDEVINTYVEEISSKLTRDPQNPVFIFEAGKVKEFTPAKSGVKVETAKLTIIVNNSLKELEESDMATLTQKVPVTETQPDIATEEVNDLGIRELIGRGVSYYRGSISSRIYNLNLAATRISGSLVAPGKYFSFNGALGDVDKLTGYKEAYVIRDGQTVLGDGGGVCQVSTTLFRAILDAGLPVTERRAHSYRVGYYEQGSAIGLDATVYSPTSDLKFLNNTDNHILIQAIPDLKNSSLVFELYGTKDGRIATTTTPVITDSTPPPEDLYIDDPTLPTGQIKQIDYKASGAKANFYYEVKKDGEIIYSKTFYSNYQPWQAKFLRGTGTLEN